MAKQEFSPAYSVENDGQRIDQFLTKQSDKSREYIQEQIAGGNISVNGKVIKKASHRLKTGDVVTATFTTESEQLSIGPIKGELHILFEDDSLIVLNKAQGLVVHPASGHDGETLVHHLLYHLQNQPEFEKSSETRPGIVHRLDKGTSGVILIGKNREIQEALSEQFKSRDVKKEYECIAWGRMEKQGFIQSNIGRDRRDRKKMSSKTDSGRDAVTAWTTLSTFQHFSHVRLFPHTGRTHQLRVHLSENRHPIVSDATYGKGFLARNKASVSEKLFQFLEPLEHPFLHAAKLSFNHPRNGDRLTFEAKRPELFESFLDLLGKYDRK